MHPVLLFIWLTLVDGCFKGFINRVFVLPDIHGDLERLIESLRMVNLINEELEWIGKAGDWLVHTGDVVDRGPFSIGCLKLLKNLRENILDRKLENTGMILLYGNHDLMMLQGLYHYVNPDELRNYGGAADFGLQFAPGTELGDFYRNDFQASAQIGEVVFVHASISSTYAGLGIKKLNDHVAAAINAGNVDRDAIFFDPGPFWFREYVMQPHKTCDDFNIALESLSAKFMVVGHTVPASGIVETRCQQRLVVADVGMSRWMLMPSSGPSMLVINFSQPIPQKNADCIQLWEPIPAEAQVTQIVSLISNNNGKSKKIIYEAKVPVSEENVEL